MSEIRINTQGGCDWLDLEDEIDFEGVVIRGNRHYKDHEEASWWKEALEIITDLDEYIEGDWEGIYDDPLFKNIPKETTDAIVSAYAKCKYSDDSEFIMKVANILHPELKLKIATIRGYCQGDWQDCIYAEGEDVDYIEAIYFGKISEIHIKDAEDEFADFITDDELWQLDREGRLKESLCKRYDLNPDDTKIFVSDGVIHTIKWKEVG